MTSWRRFDWDAVAGIVAAVVGLVLHLLHIVEEDVLLSVILVILALILLRDLRREEVDEHTSEAMERIDQSLNTLAFAAETPDTILIGPPHLRDESQRFAEHAVGDMTWFNVCLLMFVPQSLFDALLRPAVENPDVRSIQFILDPKEQDRWHQAVMPKVRECTGGAKVLEPIWHELDDSVSFILGPMRPHGKVEAHVSFWGEPFMARTAGQDIPRYVFHVQPHSELIGRLIDVGRQYRAGTKEGHR